MQIIAMASSYPTRPPGGTDHPVSATRLSSGLRYAAAAAFILVALLLLAGALAIPFAYESPSMWYQFGAAKVSLRTGKLMGMAAVVLLLLQLPLAGRSRVLDRIFSFFGLIRQHRIHAWIIVAMALSHPICVLGADGKWTVPLEMRYWPEWIGVVLLASLLIQLICSQWRQRMKLGYRIWLTAHRISGLLIVALLVAHVLYVSETFSEPGLPRTALLTAAGIFCLYWLWVRAGWLRVRRRPYQVIGTETVAQDATRIDLEPMTQRAMGYAPGQFVFVSFRGSRPGCEPHPFTLSSTPSRPERLQLTIRACGDWTRQVNQSAVGDRVLVQGPYGRFSHLFVPPDRDLIMIAGGIGITPMLSMLRFMADQEDQRPITLIWSNRSRRQVVYAEELDHLKARLTGLRRVPIFTQQTDVGGHPSRLNRSRLADLLQRNSRDSIIFLCGPPRMMAHVATTLKAIGFSGRSIIAERFGV
jgi:predicted ferric reductase